MNFISNKPKIVKFNQHSIYIKEDGIVLQTLPNTK